MNPSRTPARARRAAAAFLAALSLAALLVEAAPATAEPVKLLKPEDYQSRIVAGRKGRVLLMDDEELVRNVAGALIRAIGHEVDCAVHGEEALTKYREAQRTGQTYDTVILDLTIRGGMGGAEALQRLLLIDRDVMAVVSSGYSDDAITSNYREHGFKAFLKKPYDIDHLQHVLNTTIAP